MLTIVRQDTKICNGTTNDFSESCLWICLLLWKREGKKTIRTLIENVEVRLIENGSRKYRDIVRLHVCLCELVMNIFSVLRASYHTKNIYYQLV